MKAHHAIPRIKKDMELGRKVVVFHDYIEGAGFNPFALYEDPGKKAGAERDAPTFGELYAEFERNNPYIKAMNFARFVNPIETLTDAFPDAMLYNGRVSDKKRRDNRDAFQDDASGKNLIIIQSNAGEAGISLHDKTGKHPRIIYNLGLPTRPASAIQQEGRIYRFGQKSNAIFRYMSTGTSWERIAFAQTIAERASTAENLALGEEARHLRESFVDAFNDAEEIEQGADEGTGGKEKDRAGQAPLSDFDRAKAFYFAQGKKRGRRDQREGKDYYATPEPVGLKMTEWADIEIGESVLEPSAGHGAIARWFPESAKRTLIEPSPTLASKASLSSPGAKVIEGVFENYHIVNKHDAVIMNPPFGKGGALAFEHVKKALGHLKNRGRVIALVPRGPAADKQWDKLLESKEMEGVFTVAEIDMPTVLFERAGTKQPTKIIVLEKNLEAYDGLMEAPTARSIDLSNADDIGEFFDRLDTINLGKRERRVVARPPVARAPARPELELPRALNSATMRHMGIPTLGDRAKALPEPPPPPPAPEPVTTESAIEPQEFANAAEAEDYFHEIIDEIGSELVPANQIALRNDLPRAEALLAEVEQALQEARKVSALGGEPLSPRQIIETDPTRGRPITGTLESQKYDLTEIVSRARERAERQARQQPAAPPPSNMVSFKTGETVHGKTGEQLFVASIGERVPRETYNRLRSIAKDNGGYYSTFKGRGAIPGFQFKSEEDRQAFLEATANVPRDPSDDIMAKIRGLHYSPYDFGRFDMSKIGTGEGAQAYGRGMYFAENRGTVGFYREALRFKAEGLTIGGKNFNNYAAKHVSDSMRGVFEAAEGAEPALERMEKLADRMDNLETFQLVAHSYVGGTSNDLRRWVKELREAIATGEKIEPFDGVDYEVDIDVEPEQMLHWDETLHDQPEGVKYLIRTNPRIYAAWNALRRGMTEEPIMGRLVKRLERDLGVQETQDLFLEAGIPGIRYLDQFSRDNPFDYMVDGQPVDIDDGVAMNVELEAAEAIRLINESDGSVSGAISNLRLVEKRSEFLERVLDLIESGRITATRRDATYNMVVLDDNLISIKSKNGEPVSSEVADDIMARIQAMHYSPYYFTKFDLSKIGSGDGKQLFGHGLYFSKAREVVDMYHKDLNHKARTVTVNGKVIQNDPAGLYLFRALDNGEKIESMPEDLRIIATSAAKNEQVRDLWGEPDQLLKAADTIEGWLADGAAIERYQGSFYDVELDMKEEELLDWNAPYAEQPEIVKKALTKFFGEERVAQFEANELSGGALYELVAERSFGDVEIASMQLSYQGVKGIQYFDAVTPTTQNPEGLTRNFVTFTDDIVKIRRIDGKPVDEAIRQDIIAKIRSVQQGKPVAEPGAPMSPEFADMVPKFRQRVLDQVSRMMPADVKVRVEDNIVHMGSQLSAQYSPMKQIVTISMDQGVDEALAGGRHEAVHVSRTMGLFSQNEWQILTERAAKVDTALKGTALEQRYREMYGASADRRNLTGADREAFINEMMDQERVARMIEPGAQYGSGINGLLQRIGDFLQAIVNAARGLGFQSSADIFRRVESGEVAGRRKTASETASGRAGLSAFDNAVDEAVDTRVWGDEDFTGTIELRTDEDGRRIRTYKTDQWGAASVIENDGTGTWAVQTVNSTDPQLVESLLAEIENDIGQYLAPNGLLTEQQMERWSSLEPENVQGHRQLGGLFHGLYAPADMARLMGDVAADLIVRSDDPGVRSRARRMVPELRSFASNFAPSVMPAMRGTIEGAGAIGSQGTGDSTGALEQGLSDLVREFNRMVTAGRETVGGRANMQRQGRLNPAVKRQAAKNGGWLAGLYSRTTGVTRLAIPMDFVTLSHEGGHALETRADTRDAINQLKANHAYDLIVPPAPDYIPKPFPPTGFTGLELDQETLDQVMLAYQGEMRMRSGALHPRELSIVQDETQRAKDAVARAVGPSPAGAVMADLLAQGLPADQAQQYALTRYTENGQAQPRQMPQYTDDQLSEAWANWFQWYVTSPETARKQAPDLYEAFGDEIDGLDPALLKTMEGIQQGYQDLINASPVEAVRSRVGTSMQPSTYQQIRERQRQRGFFGGLGATMSDWWYYLMRDYEDDKHPMKVAVKYITDLAVANNRIKLDKNERVALKAIMDPYKRARLAEHARAHATAVLQGGVRFRGQVRGQGASYRQALETAFGGSAASKWSDEMIEKFGAYLITRRMLAEFDRYDNGDLPNLPDQLIERSKYAQARNDLEKENPQFVKAADQLYEFQRNVLKWQLEEGFITKKEYDDYVNRPDYAPLNRIMDQQGAVSQLSKTKATGRNKARMIHRFLGSTRDFINPLESIAQNVYQVQSRVELNGVIRTLDQLVRAAGPGGGAIAERLPRTDMRGTKVNLREALQQAAKKQKGLDPVAFDTLMQEVDSLFDTDASAQIFRATETSDAGERIVYLWENGQRVPILMGETEIARDIFAMYEGFGRENADFVTQGFTLSAQLLRFGVTKAPAYVMVNYLRDQVATWILSPSYTPFVSGFRGLAAVSLPAAAGIAGATAGVIGGGLVGAPLLAGVAAGAVAAATGKALTASKLIDQKKLSETSEMYNYFAGLMGGIDSSLMMTSTAKRDVKAMRKEGFWAVPGGTVVGRTWNSFLRTMEITEAGTRVGHMEAAYQRAIKDGMTPEEAAYEAAYAAHDVMDFSRRGQLIGNLSRWVPFLNASVQGLSAMRRTVGGERNVPKSKGADTYRALATPYLKATQGQPLSKVEKEMLPLSLKATVKMMGLGLVGLALAANYDDDEEYKEFNDYMRATHWFFKIGGTWYRFPKPFELAFFSNLYEAAWEGFRNDNPRAATQFVESLKHTLIPPHEIQAVKFWYELSTGKNMFTGRDIIALGEKANSPRMQANGYTSEMGKLIGNITGMSPAMVDHFIAGGFATLGRDAMAVSNSVLPQVNQLTGGMLPGVRMTPRREQSMEERFIISRFTRDPSRGALSTQYFWDQMSPTGGKFISAAQDYKDLYDAGITPTPEGIRAARNGQDYLNALDPERKAYAMLAITDHFSANDRRLHPLNRAKEVLAVGRGIRKQMMTDIGIIVESTKDTENRQTIILNPTDQRKVTETLSDIALREAHNALVVTGVEGWAHKKILPVDGLLEELRAISPAVADEYEARQLTKRGQRKVLPFEAVAKYWPEAKERILKDGFDADISDLVTDARYY